MNIVIAILIFSLIIVIHELGHFMLAKANGVFVTEFSVGMGPRILSLVKTKNRYHLQVNLSHHDIETNVEIKENTIYSWKVLPIGGSCMMLGEDETSDDDRAFNKKGVWGRISVIFAGPLFNFILAFILSMFVVGAVGYDPAYVTEVSSNSPAEEVGIQTGDIITEINGKNINLGREIATFLQYNPLSGEPVSISYLRDDIENTVTLQPVKQRKFILGFRYTADTNPAVLSEIIQDFPLYNAGIRAGDTLVKIEGTSIANGAELKEYLIKNPLSEKTLEITYTRDGVEYDVQVTPALASDNYSIGISFNTGRVKTNALGVIKYSAVEVKYWIVTTIEGLGQLISGKVGADELAGPVGIVNIIDNTIEESKSDGTKFVLLNIANISILLSANLGVMNLLPLPALDGGRLVFLFLELFRGKPIDQNKEGLVHMIGLALLMLLMLFIMYNDISRLFL
jgi:regulator of sigma E protease